MSGLNSQQASWAIYGFEPQDNTNTWTTSPKTYSSTVSLTSDSEDESYITGNPAIALKKIVPEFSDSPLKYRSLNSRVDRPFSLTGAHNPSQSKPHPKHHHTLGVLPEPFNHGQNKALATDPPVTSSHMLHSATRAITADHSHVKGEAAVSIPPSHSNPGQIVKFWQKITRRRRWSDGDAQRKHTLVADVVFRVASMVKEREEKAAKKEEDKKKDKMRNPMSGYVTASKVVSTLVRHGCEDLSQKLNDKRCSKTPITGGGFSDIYHGRLFDGTLVAIKAWRPVAQQTIGQDTEQLLHAARELYTWSKCKHRNVLPLLGLANFRDKIGMVSPWMGNGTLPQYIRTNPSANRHDLCVQICEGLSYLHDNGVVHGDLKGLNVLISASGTPFLADFGSSTIRDQTLKIAYPGEIRALTTRWSAPELLTDKTREHGGQTKSSDIYALGMTIYEIITGNIPYHLVRIEIRVMYLVIQGEHPIRPICMPADHESRDKLWDLLALCWRYSPEARPNATRVVEMMKHIKLDGVAYHIPPSQELKPEPLPELLCGAKIGFINVLPFH